MADGDRVLAAKCIDAMWVYSASVISPMSSCNGAKIPSRRIAFKIVSGNHLARADRRDAGRVAPKLVRY